MSNEHYARLNPQTIHRLQDVLTPEEFQGFCRGNILKYAERMRHKDEPVKEAAKIVDYARWLEQSLKGEKVVIDNEKFFGKDDTNENHRAER